MEENKRMTPSMNKRVEWCGTAGSSTPQRGGERCCGIKDAGYKGEQLEGKWRNRRTDMMSTAGWKFNFQCLSVISTALPIH